MSIDDARPIWIQLAETFRIKIVSGQWGPASKIPSVRELALESGVNPNTIQRALSELDREGLTIAERAQGRFVTTDKDAIARTRSELAAGATDDHIATLARIGLGLDDARRLLETRWFSHTKTPQGGARS